MTDSEIYDFIEETLDVDMDDLSTDENAFETVSNAFDVYIDSLWLPVAEYMTKHYPEDEE